MDAKEVLQQHFDKVALGVAGLILLVGLILNLGGTDADATQAQIQQYNATIDATEAQASQAAPEGQTFNYYAAVADKDFRHWTVGGEAGLQLFPGWVLHRRPYVYQRIPTVNIPESLKPTHGRPVGFAAEASPGAIQLTWDRDIQLSNSQYVVIEYSIVRYLAGESTPDPDFTPVRLSDRAASYEDTTAEPDKAYEYRLISRASVDKTSPPYQQYGELLSGPEPPEYQTDPTDVVRVLPLFNVEIINTIEVNEEWVAFLYIENWDKAQQSYRKSGRIQFKVGERIRHEENVPGRGMEKWDTPYEILDIGYVTVEVDKNGLIIEEEISQLVVLDHDLHEKLLREREAMPPGERPTLDEVRQSATRKIRQEAP